MLVRGGETTVVQAKHWRRDRVGVGLVRELYGVQTAQRADHATFVALGSYTADARELAAQIGMTLIDGEERLQIIETGLLARPSACSHRRRSAPPRARAAGQ